MTWRRSRARCSARSMSCSPALAGWARRASPARRSRSAAGGRVHRRGGPVQAADALQLAESLTVARAREPAEGASVARPGAPGARAARQVAAMAATVRLKQELGDAVELALSPTWAKCRPIARCAMPSSCSADRRRRRSGECPVPGRVPGARGAAQAVRRPGRGHPTAPRRSCRTRRRSRSCSPDRSST